MNSKELYRAISEVDDDILERSEAVTKVRRKKNKGLKWGALAACLCLVIVGAVIWRQIQPSHTEGTGIIISENGVTIPQMNVSLSANEAADMMGFFIYQGKCYVWYERIYDDVDIIGEHLGTATGLINEWTPKEGYVELAGSVKGDFYSVRGYDPAFMLCMKEPDGTVSTYICNNGLTLKYGSELYEDRLHLSGNFEAVQYESRASWYHGRGERYQMNSINDIVLDFIKGMNSSQFVPCDSVPLDEGHTSLADTELYHMYFQMKDGTTVHLRLHENGYVKFNGMSALCVQIPEENYNPLLNLLDNHTDAAAVEVTESVGPTFEDCLNNVELGRYVPAYAPEDINFTNASIYYYLDSQTANEIGTKEIWLCYDSLENSHYYYSITITRADEYGRNGWAGPMIAAADLSVESISEYIKTETTMENSLPENRLDVGVWYDDASVVISARGIDAETAYEILSSVQ